MVTISRRPWHGWQFWMILAYVGLAAGLVMFGVVEQQRVSERQAHIRRTAHAACLASNEVRAGIRAFLQQVLTFYTADDRRRVLYPALTRRYFAPRICS